MNQGSTLVSISFSIPSDPKKQPARITGFGVVGGPTCPASSFSSFCVTSCIYLHKHNQQASRDVGPQTLSNHLRCRCRVD